MTTVAITIEFDPDRLHTYTDTHLAMLWHVGQANPDNGFEASIAGDLAERIGREIIHRWLRGVPQEMHRHQGRHYYWHQLAKFATYQPPANISADSPDWHHGTWVARPTPEDTGDTADTGARAATMPVRHGDPGEPS